MNLSRGILYFSFELALTGEERNKARSASLGMLEAEVSQEHAIAVAERELAPKTIPCPPPAADE